MGQLFTLLRRLTTGLPAREAHCHKVGAAAGASRSGARRAQRSDDVAALLHSVTAFLRQSPTAKPTTADHRSITMCAPLNGSRMSMLTDTSCHCAGCALAVLCNFTRITISSFSVLSDGTHAILEPTCICTVTVETGVYHRPLQTDDKMQRYAYLRDERAIQSEWLTSAHRYQKPVSSVLSLECVGVLTV